MEFKYKVGDILEKYGIGNKTIKYTILSSFTYSGTNYYSVSSSRMQFPIVRNERSFINNHTKLIGNRTEQGEISVTFDPPFNSPPMVTLKYKGCISGRFISKESNLSNLPKQTKCECGKEKHGFASHSQWCDKYGENKK